MLDIGLLLLERSGAFPTHSPLTKLEISLKIKGHAPVLLPPSPPVDESKRCDTKVTLFRRIRKASLSPRFVDCFRPQPQDSHPGPSADSVVSTASASLLGVRRIFYAYVHPLPRPRFLSPGLRILRRLRHRLECRKLLAALFPVSPGQLALYSSSVVDAREVILEYCREVRAIAVAVLSLLSRDRMTMPLFYGALYSGERNYILWV